MNKLILLVFYVSLLVPFQAFNNKIDSLNSELIKVSTPQKKALLLIEIAYLKKYDNLEESISVTLENLKILEEQDDLNGIGIAKSYLGVYFYLKNQLPKAIMFLKDAERLFVFTKNNDRLYRVYNNLGIAYSSFYDYNSAILYFNKVLQLKQLDSSNPDIATNLINISTIYYDQGDYLKCIKTNERALILTLQKENNEATAIIYANLGASHERLGNYKKSINFALKALDLYQNNVDDPRSEIRTYTNLGVTYMAQNLLEEANHYFTLALDLISKKNYFTQEAVVLNNLSELKRKSGKTEESEKLAKSALFLADSTDNQEEKLISLETLSNIKKDNGDFESALNYYQQYIYLSDSLMEVSNFQKTQLALAQNELAIEQAKQEKDESQNELIQKKTKVLFTFIYLLGGIIFLWVISLIFKIRLPAALVHLSTFFFSIILIGSSVMFLILKTNLINELDFLTFLGIIIFILIVGAVFNKLIYRFLVSRFRNE